MKIKLTKANANGNSFILINNIPKKSLINSSIISDICNQYNTDGLIMLNSSNINNIIMDYYNNDGSWETLCINGLTCIGLLLNNTLSKKKFEINCGSSIYSINILKNNYIKISMPEPKYKSKKISVENLEGFYIDSGAKHFVTEINSKWPSDNEIKNIAKRIRYNKKLFPDGINVNFYQVFDTESLKIKTYEKGIEDLMQSCASGSYACAYHCHYKNMLKGNIKIINPGGEFEISFNKDYTKNYITNKAKLEFSSLINL